MVVITRQAREAELTLSQTKPIHCLTFWRYKQINCHNSTWQEEKNLRFSGYTLVRSSTETPPLLHLSSKVWSEVKVYTDCICNLEHSCQSLVHLRTGLSLYYALEHWLYFPIPHNKPRAHILWEPRKEGQEILDFREFRGEERVEEGEGVPSVNLARPPVGVHRTDEQLLHTTTVCEWLNTVVLHHLTVLSMTQYHMRYIVDCSCIVRPSLIIIDLVLDSKTISDCNWLTIGYDYVDHIRYVWKEQAKSRSKGTPFNCLLFTSTTQSVFTEISPLHAKSCFELRQVENSHIVTAKNVAENQGLQSSKFRLY